MPQVSRQAVVEDGAVLADDVRVGPFSYIGPHVRIGPGCLIENNATIQGRTTLGRSTRVFPLAVIGASPPGQDLPDKKAGECILGEANAIREHVTIFAGGRTPTQIGNHNLIMIACQIGSGAVLGDHGIFDNCCQVGPSAVIEDYVRMSGFASVGPAARVGAYSFVAGYAGVTGQAPPYAMLQGFPVRVRGVNSRNLKACGFGEGDIHALKEAFRELFGGPSDKPDRHLLERMARDRKLNPYVRVLVEALRRAPAGAGDGGDD